MFAALPSTRTATIPLERLVGFLLLAAALAVVAGRLSFAAELPLWIDETWSAMIASRPNWSSFWREAWLDCNPPFYYLLLSLWIEMAGESNLMLRLPSIVFVVAAAVVPLIWRPKGLNRMGIWAWSAFMLLWPFGIFVMLEIAPLVASTAARHLAPQVPPPSASFAHPMYFWSIVEA